MCLIYMQNSISQGSRSDKVLHTSVKYVGGGGVKITLKSNSYMSFLSRLNVFRKRLCDHSFCM